MALKFNYNQSKRTLSLTEVLEGMLESGLVDKSQVEFILRKKKRSQNHPLLSVYECDVPDLWKSMTRAFNKEAPEYVYEACGCEDCKQSGYKGRMSIYELVPMDEELRNTVKEGVELKRLEEVAQGKYLPMRLHAASKVEQGITSIEEVLRVII